MSACHFTSSPFNIEIISAFPFVCSSISLSLMSDESPLTIISTSSLLLLFLSFTCLSSTIFLFISSFLSVCFPHAFSFMSFSSPSYLLYFSLLIYLSVFLTFSFSLLSLVTSSILHPSLYSFISSYLSFLKLTITFSFSHAPCISFVKCKLSFHFSFLPSISLVS